MQNLIPQKAYRNRLYNTLGLQAFRYIIAKFALNVRRLSIKNKNLSDLKLKGIQFFYPSDDDIKKLENEFKSLKENLLRKTNLKDFNPKRILLNDESTKVERLEFQFKELKNSNRFFNICKYISESKIWDIVSEDFGSRITLENNQIIWFDKITYGHSSDVSNWHTDTFFDNYKYWLYPDGISSIKGIPMNYLPRSQRFSLKRVLLEYLLSTRVKETTDLSWRLNKKFLDFFSIDPINNECPPFTGFLANTHGFHSRAKVASGSIRYQLHFTIRSNNPFSLFYKK